MLVLEISSFSHDNLTYEFSKLNVKKGGNIDYRIEGLLLAVRISANEKQGGGAGDQAKGSK